jgi:hypothetical protein
MSGDSNRPEKAFKVGAVRAAIWANPRVTSAGKTFHSHKIAIERTYKDSREGFKSTTNLEVNDIPKAIIALQRAYEYCIAANQKSGSANEKPDFISTGW